MGYIRKPVNAKRVREDDKITRGFPLTSSVSAFTINNHVEID